ncbi:hypothetical protein LTR56_012460 [Elasticomyces elasticus]|nr:hypothetical protein LTR56_012460 [Elasticomyces elasticus]KAK3647648.1 hypothetical protein LTR22_013704 [Elasticomyces elasticus]KAK4906676.1 hypothetical protein LTR49_024189 [Elasticomyces elasticus]KAK5763709.1 hypothetical protein LTS12_006041 [Elasticomyces elasticus]
MRDRRNTILSVSSSGTTHSARSSLSEQFSFSSPLASPTLPPPVTKENRRRTHFGRTAFLKLLAATLVVLLLFRELLCWTSTDVDSPNASLPSQAGVAPTAVLVPDSTGHTRWTVSIPSNSSFPLNNEQYSSICHEGEVLREKLARNSRIGRLRDFQRHRGYYAKDWSYLDVSETSSSIPAASNQSNTCSTSLTVALDSDASFGKSLLLLWLSYGLAKHEGRAFFVDDSRWAYGEYPATAQWTFGALFEQEFASGHRAGHSRPIFDMLRTGYQDLFKLIGEDAAYARARTADLRAAASSRGESVVAMHIRRGDLHPHEHQYSGDYLPLERYAAHAKTLYQSLAANASEAEGRHDAQASVLLASDDPDILQSSSLAHAASPLMIQRVQERIQLATKATLDRTSPVEPFREPGSAYVKHVDENSGWEGGFFSALFYSLGNAQSRTLEQLNQLPTLADAVPAEAMRMRELVGRAYLLDLAVLGQSDGVVCAVSSAACRILGVIGGWDAVKDGRWVNVDDGRPWSWDGRERG